MLVVPGLCAHIEPDSLRYAVRIVTLREYYCCLQKPLSSRCCGSRLSSTEQTRQNHDQYMFCGL